MRSPAATPAIQGSLVSFFILNADEMKADSIKFLEQPFADGDAIGVQCVWSPLASDRDPI
jgi:hypothetical protein